MCNLMACKILSGTQILISFDKLGIGSHCANDNVFDRKFSLKMLNKQKFSNMIWFSELLGGIVKFNNS